MEKLLTEFEKSSFEDWLKEAESALKGKSPEILYSHTYEGIKLKPLYTAEEFDYIPTKQAAGVKWNLIQEIPYREPANFNQALSTAVENGLNGVEISISNPNAQSKSTKGTNIISVKDFEICLTNINPEKFIVYLNPATYNLVYATLFISYLKRKGYDLSRIKGGLNFDILGKLLTDGKIGCPLEKCYDLMYLLTNWANNYSPNFKTVAINGCLYREAGGNAVQELAFAFASAVEYMDELIKRGSTAFEAANSIWFYFSAGSDFFMEIAKFRAAKKIWDKIISEFGLDGNKHKINILVKPQSLNKSALDKHTNILRLTGETLAAIFGGAENIRTGLFDEYSMSPNEFSLRLSRNIQNVLREECNLTEVEDPAKGSYYLESLTSELAMISWDLFREIEGVGGMSKALIQGIPQIMVEKIANQRLSNISLRKDVLIGTNKYPDLNENFVVSNENLSYNSEVSNIQNYPNFDQIISKMKNSENLIETLIELSNDGYTALEIGAALHPQNSLITQIKPLSFIRLADDFEKLREKSNQIKENTGEFPKVLIANIVIDKPNTRRLDFIKEFLSVGGIDTIITEQLNSPESAAEFISQSSIKTIVICSDDEHYPEIIPIITKKIKSEKNEVFLLLAGNPADKIDDYKKAGIDEFIHLKSDIVRINNMILDRFN